MRSRRRSQGGFALLLVFLMAAIIALMLYQQLPRVAFETEREKEQLLIDRGEQYTRAIQLYYLANNRQYPTSLDDLEKREKRFLRRRYVDPFTGKDEEMTRVFIPSCIKDNIKGIKKDPKYYNHLLLLPELQRKAYLDGDWHAMGGTMFPEFRSKHRDGEPPEACHAASLSAAAFALALISSVAGVPSGRSQSKSQGRTTRLVMC